MPMKGGPKKLVPGSPMREVRLRQCMQNSTRLRQLGLQETSVYPNTSAIAQDKNKRYQRTREDSGSEYDPLQDASAEGDISDGATTTTEHGSKTNNQALDASSGLKFRSRKRVYADMEPTTTRAKSKKCTAQPNVMGAHAANNTRDECDNEMTHEDVVDANPQSANTTRDECNDEMANEGGFEDKEPNALDLFKLCHFSKKTQGYTHNVQLAIDEMEAQLTSPPGEGEEPNSTTEIVAAVLEDNTKKNMFLQNVGIKTARPRSTLQKVQAQLEVEKQANVDLREKVVDLEKKAKESEQARLKDKEEMKKKQDEFETRLERRFRQHLPAD
ncbi:unnamed protein product [Urochloa decumbens]|uniref:Uncharacterized protein n=1 Tax=Urochloa decumbens TaxID=240449 RepID=A0ABC9HDN3_9POAL